MRFFISQPPLIKWIPAAYLLKGRVAFLLHSEVAWFPFIGRWDIERDQQWSYSLVPSLLFTVIHSYALQYNIINGILWWKDKASPSSADYHPSPLSLTVASQNYFCRLCILIRLAVSRSSQLKMRLEIVIEICSHRCCLLKQIPYRRLPTKATTPASWFRRPNGPQQIWPSISIMATWHGTFECRRHASSPPKLTCSQPAPQPSIELEAERK